MSEQTTNTTPTAESAPAAQQIDTAKITQEVAAIASEAASKAAEQAASKIAEKRLKDAARMLTGEPETPQVNPYLARMVQNPEGHIIDVIETTEKRVLDRVNKERHAENVIRSVGNKYAAEYPQITEGNKLALVEKLMEQNERSGMPKGEALEHAFQATAKEFGLKSVSDMQREGNYQYSLPFGAGGVPMGGQPRFDDSKSTNDFFSGMKARASATRKRSI